MGDKSGTCRFDCFQFSHTLVAVAFSYNVQQSTCTCEVDGQLQKLIVLRAFTEPYKILESTREPAFQTFNCNAAIFSCAFYGKPVLLKNLHGILLCLQEMSIPIYYL